MSVKTKLVLALTLLITAAVAQATGGKPADKPAAKPAEAGNGCQSQLLQAFQLDGLGNDKAVDMTICPSVTASNNCCSVIDEIKAVKSWSNYSKPKLNLFVEDAADTIERMIGLHPYVERLNDMYIRFHYEEIVKKYTKTDQCFDKETLLSTGNFRELIKETYAGKEWYLVYIKNYIDVILSRIRKTDAYKVITSEDSLKTISLNLQNNKEFTALLAAVNTDYLFEETTKDIVSTLR